MERILAEETADGVAYVILHEEDEDRNGQDQEQRKLAEVSCDLIADLGSLQIEFRPVAELRLADVGYSEADFSNDDEDKETLPVVFLEEVDDLFLVVRENKTCQECGSGVDPPFAMEPEYLLLHPPCSFVHIVVFAAPPVVGTCPPCVVAFDHGAYSHKDYECEDDLKACLAVAEQTEGDEEQEIKDSEDYREPCKLVHHGNTQEIEDPLFIVHRKSYERYKCAVDQDVNIVGDDDRLNDPFLYEAFKITGL